MGDARMDGWGCEDGWMGDARMDGWVTRGWMDG